ncbi:tyrosine-type recombinase/integrase [Terrabacter sp. NPDC080008]|uniref:tyrosine-type recombinase/integrase n=1 Tax=Terrabacter sp. NPDC080008 TaxID=3155176 RepID=UPI00344EBAF5
MSRKPLPLGHHGEPEVTPQFRDAEGKWKRHPTGKGKGVERWRARVYYRGHDGMLGEVTRVSPRKPEALDAALRAVEERMRLGSGSSAASPTRPLLEAGQAWLALIARSDSGLSPRTVADYTASYNRHLDCPGSSLRGLSLGQANEPARIRAWLQGIADGSGTGAAKMARSVLSGILQQSVDDGVLQANGARQVRPVKAQPKAQQDATEGALSGSGRRQAPRDTTRALTRSERDSVIAYADELAGQPAIERVSRKRRAVADLTAFMAGTGVRIAEARGIRWEHVDLTHGRVQVHGTKSKGSRRLLTLPHWLAERMRHMAEANGTKGYVFSSPSAGNPEQQWDQSNCAAALADVLAGAGFPWATPHTFRRTVATLLSEQGAPIARIADQLGHSDPAMTASVYLGRDFEGDKSDLAALL